MKKTSPTESQRAKILAYLQKGYSVTPISALEKFQCFRLGARIWDLKDKGHQIQTDMVDDKKTGKRYASYRLSGVEPKKERALPGKTVSDFSKALNQPKQSQKIQDQLF
jgi:hypothetical protein